MYQVGARSLTPWFARWYWLNDDGVPVQCVSVQDITDHDGDRVHIGLTKLPGYCIGHLVLIQPVKISTVFLRLDHGFYCRPDRHRIKPQPMLFESMVFGGPLDGEQDRYCTIEEAQDGHQIYVKRARIARWFGRRMAEWLVS